MPELEMTVPLPVHMQHAAAGEREPVRCHCLPVRVGLAPFLFPSLDGFLGKA